MRPLLKIRVGLDMGPTLQKLPRISSLKFAKAFHHYYGQKKTWMINDYQKKSGIYIIRKDQEIVRIGIAAFCLTKAIQKFFSNLAKQGIKGNDFMVAVLLAPKENIPVLYEELLLERKRIPIEDSYQKIKSHLAFSEPLPIALLNFRPPYQNVDEAQRTYGFEYNGRSGVYIIKENGLVTYVGKAVTTNTKGGLYSVMYHHFHPYGTDRETAHYRVEYSATLRTHIYEVALIEVPSLGKTRSELDKEVSLLESRLILELNPRDNIKGLPEQKPEPFLQVVYYDEARPVIVRESGDSDELPF